MKQTHKGGNRMQHAVIPPQVDNDVFAKPVVNAHRVVYANNVYDVYVFAHINDVTEYGVYAPRFVYFMQPLEVFGTSTTSSRSLSTTSPPSPFSLLFTPYSFFSPTTCSVCFPLLFSFLFLHYSIID